MGLNKEMIQQVFNQIIHNSHIELVPELHLAETLKLAKYE